MWNFSFCWWHSSSEFCQEHCISLLPNQGCRWKVVLILFLVSQKTYKRTFYLWLIFLQHSHLYHHEEWHCLSGSTIILIWDFFNSGHLHFGLEIILLCHGNTCMGLIGRFLMLDENCFFPFLYWSFARFFLFDRVYFLAKSLLAILEFSSTTLIRFSHLRTSRRRRLVSFCALTSSCNSISKSLGTVIQQAQ